MWHPNIKMETKPFSERIEPVEVLYYFDEPLVFGSRTDHFPVLCYKTDDDVSLHQYLVVQSSGDVIDNVRVGRISLREALLQPWCWIVETDIGFNIKHSWGLNINDIPESMLPDRGYAINPQHGIIEEAAVASVSAPFLSIHFKGGELKRDAIPLNIFKTLLDDAYASIWKIFTPAVYKLFNTERELRRVVNIPVREPAFNSLLIEIEQPELDVSVMKEPSTLDIENTAERLNFANAHFLQIADQLAKTVGSRAVLNQVTHDNFDVLAIVSQLAPTERSYYDVLEISGRTMEETRPVITIGTEAGEMLRVAYKAALGENRTIIGIVVEISARSSTFIVRTERYREVTCVPTRPEVFEEIAPLVTGAQVRMTGIYVERKRRDLLNVHALEITELPRGRSHISG